MELPIEVSEAVIDLASDNAVTLRSLCLTCAAFLPRRRYHLFNGICIRTVEQMKSSRDFLDANPWLLPPVHKVSLSFEVPNDYDKPNIRLLDVVPIHFLTRLPNLHTWTMGPANFLRGPSLSLHHSALSLYSRNSSRIQSLALYSIRFYRLSDFIGLVSAFTSIHTLTCCDIKFRREEEPNHSLSIGGTGLLVARPLQVSTLTVSF